MSHSGYRSILISSRHALMTLLIASTTGNTDRSCLDTREFLSGHVLIVASLQLKNERVQTQSSLEMSMHSMYEKWHI